MKNLKRGIKLMKTNKGITLIALVVTIIVLLILAGVSINLLFGENGIIQKSSKASIETEKAKITEAAILAYNSVVIDYQGKVDENTIANLTVAEMKRMNYDIKDITTTAQGITELNIDKANMTINKGDTETIIITFQEGLASSSRYFVKIQEKYYELIVVKDRVELGEEAIDVDAIETSNSNNEVTVTSQNESIVTVERTGNIITVTPVAVGTSKITVNAGSLTKECNVTVTNIITSVTCDKETVTVNEGSSQTLTATISPTTAEGELTWELVMTGVTNSIATISASGTHKEVLTIEGINEGTGTIYCKNSEGTILKQIALTVQIQRYTVTYISGGTTYDTATVVEGQSVTLPTGLTMSGYTFEGWSLTDGGTVINDTTYTPNEDIILYAKWSVESFAIEYILNGGQNHSSNPSSYSAESNEITLQAPTRSGYNFSGWTYEGQTTPISTVIIPTGSSGDKSYTANWNLDINSTGAYISNGLILCLDGIKNTTTGHSSSTTTWYDLSGRGKNASLNSVTVNSKCMTFNGTSSYATIADGAFGNYGASTFEVVVKVKNTNTASANAVVLIDSATKASSSHVRAFSIYNGNIISHARTAGSDTIKTYYSNGTSLLNSIKGYSLVFDGSSLSNTLAYVNGSQTSKTTSTSSQNAAHTARMCYIGRRSLDSGSQCYLNGDIYAIRVYNRQLSASEIASNLAIDKARFGF